MTPGYKVVLLAIDSLQMAVGQDLSARYCPHSKVVFLMRFWTIFAVFVIAALLPILAAHRSTKSPSGRAPLYLAAGILLLFAIGGAARCNLRGVEQAKERPWPRRLGLLIGAVEQCQSHRR